jgi:hypothetical protein
MKIADSKQTFMAHLQQSGMTLDSLTPDDGVDAMLQFYSDERADECKVDTDADMLLFQWGTHDWGEGKHFEFDITRQFIHAAEDDDCIWQLSLLFRFAASEELDKLESGNKWCGKLGSVQYFGKFIRDSDSYQTVARTTGYIVELELENAG